MAERRYALINQGIPVTDAERAASITPTDLSWPEGDIRRLGSVGDGVADDSTAFTTYLIAGGFNVFIPTGTYKLDSSQILVGSNTTIRCGPNVTVRKDGDGTDGGWIRFKLVSNIAIYGNHSIWEYVTKPSSNEFRHIFDLRGCTNFYIDNVLARKSGGDGFFIGPTAGLDYSERVVFKNVRIDNCRRQGISIVSVKTMHVDGATITNITGTAPQAGIDLEPNTNLDFLTDITLDNIVTDTCSGPGIKVDLRALTGNNDKNVSIVVNSPVDRGSVSAIFVSKLHLNGNVLDGHIIFNDPMSIDARNPGITMNNYDALGPHVYFNRPVIIRPNAADSSSESLGAGILIYRPSSVEAPAAANIGACTFTDVVIDDNRSSPNITQYIFVKDQSTTLNDDMHDVNFSIKYLNGVALSTIFVYMDADGHFDDPDRQTQHDTADSAYAMGNNNYNRYVTNTGATGTVTVTMGANVVDWPLVTFEVTVAQLLRIDVDGSSKIEPGSNGVGKYIQSNVIGSRLTLARKSATQWFIVEEIGTWSHQA